MPLGNDVLEREEKWGEIIKQGKVRGLWGAWSYRNGRPRALPQKNHLTTGPIQRTILFSHFLVI